MRILTRVARGQEGGNLHFKVAEKCIASAQRSLAQRTRLSSKDPSASHPCPRFFVTFFYNHREEGNARAPWLLQEGRDTGSGNWSKIVVLSHLHSFLTQREQGIICTALSDNSASCNARDVDERQR